MLFIKVMVCLAFYMKNCRDWSNNIYTFLILKRASHLCRPASAGHGANLIWSWAGPGFVASWVRFDLPLAEIFWGWDQEFLWNSDMSRGRFWGLCAVQPSHQFSKSCSGLLTAEDSLCSEVLPWVSSFKRQLSAHRAPNFRTACEGPARLWSFSLVTAAASPASLHTQQRHWGTRSAFPPHPQPETGAPMFSSPPGRACHFFKFTSFSFLCFVSIWRVFFKTMIL